MPGKNPHNRPIRIGTLLFLILCIAGYTNLSFASQETTLIPLEDFFKNPERTSFEISPDGEHIDRKSVV